MNYGRVFQQVHSAARRRRRKRRRMATLLLVVLGVGGYALGKLTPWFEAPDPRLEARLEELSPAPSCRDVLCKIPWPSPTPSEGGGYEEIVDGKRIVYSLDRDLQEQALEVFARYKVPYGAFVAVEPATGRVLALAEYSHDEPDLHDFCRRATYPAASLIKVVTAVAALETGQIEPTSKIRYEGDMYKLRPRKISPRNARRENNVSTFAEALGKSNNVVFGKVGVDVVGAERLEATLAAFGFNRSIPFDFRLQESRATVPREPFPLARTAAGFEEVYLSPLHAALIAAAIGNGGLMMQPYMVDAMEDAKGRVLYRAAPAPLLRSTSPEIAARVSGMMERTVSRGTSSKVFYRYARKLRREVGVAGKTGSLSGHDPPGRYEWFIGFAPVDDPRIAVASLVVNRGDLWHIKGTYVAQAVMKEFFGR